MKPMIRTILTVGWLLPLGLVIGWKLPLNTPDAPATPVVAEAPVQDDFRARVRDYLLQEPEVLMEALQVLEQRRDAAQAQGDQVLVSANADAIFNDGISWVGGNPDGDITLVEYQDYRCGFCRRAHSEVTELIESDGNIRLIVKEFPILGKASTLSSQLAVSVLQNVGPAEYKRLSDTLITYQGPLDEPAMRRLLTGLNIDADAALEHVDSTKVQDHIRAIHDQAAALQISGTPTFILQNELIRGYVPLDEMRKMVALQREITN